jgi:O-antigen/teichoic acid export membrane protein
VDRVDRVTSVRSRVAGQAEYRGSRIVDGKFSAPASARNIWRRHGALLSNVASLAATTGVTSGLGFVYWAVAARLFSVQDVGYGSAAISAMTLLGTVGMLGLGTLLIGEIPRRESPGGLVLAALLFSTIASLVLGVAFAVVAPVISSRFFDIGGNFIRACLFSTGVAVTALTLVLDQATIGLLRGGLQFGRNITASIVKVLVLPASAVLLGKGLGAGLIASWVAGTVISLIVVLIRMWWSRALIFHRPDWTSLRRLGRTTLAHNWLNLSIAIRQSIIPVLVAVVISPSANAAFYAAWMLAGFLAVVPAHLSTVLFAVTSADEDAVADKIRFTLRLSFVIGIPGMAVMALLGHPLLAVFGAHYVLVGTVPLLTLIVAYIPSVARAHYIAVYRIKGRMGHAAAVMWVVMGLEIAAAVVGGRSYGLFGLSVALLVVRIAEGIVTTPAVVATARRRGRHRRAGSVAAPVSEMRAGAGPNMSLWDRQQDGISALIAMSLLGGEAVQSVAAADGRYGAWSTDQSAGSWRGDARDV